MAVCVIITSVLATTLSAQTSSQNYATAGVFAADADNFMNVNYYGDVEFGKWFGYLDGNSNGTLGLGYATKFGSVYLGGFYNGNILTKYTNSSKTAKTQWDTDYQKLNGKIDEEYYGSNYTTFNNNIDLLLGVAGMGFKVGFYHYLTTYDKPNGVTSRKTDDMSGTVTYSGTDSYEQSYSSMTPSLLWGMKLNLGNKVLAPRLGGSVNFYTSEVVSENYDTPHSVYNGKPIGMEQKNINGSNGGYLGLNVLAGADYYLNDSMYIGLDYSLRMNFYDQDLGQAGGNGSVKGTINWTGYTRTYNYLDRTVKDDYTNINITEQSYMYHSITPALWKELLKNDDVKFGILAKLPVTIRSETSDNYTDRLSITETTYNDASRSSENSKTTQKQHRAGLKTETSTFSITPSIGFGACYSLIPGKFSINAGVNVYPVSYSRSSTTQATNGLDSEYNKTETPSGITSETSEVNVPYDPDGTAGANVIYDKTSSYSTLSLFSGNLFMAGFTVNFNENFTLDTALMMSSISDNYLNILFTVKY
jgi:hypothetical protein